MVVTVDLPVGMNLVRIKLPYSVFYEKFYAFNEGSR
jgi:hypothetical protein